MSRNETSVQYNTANDSATFSATFNQTNNFISGILRHFKYRLFPKDPGSSRNTINNKRKASQLHSLDREFLFEKIDVNLFRNDEKSWVNDDNVVGKKFQQYQIAVIEQLQSEELLIETNAQELLALSNILLIKPDQSSVLFDNFLTAQGFKLLIYTFF